MRSERTVADPQRSTGSVDAPAGTRNVIAADFIPGIFSASRVNPFAKVCW
jgi:hypothetical protein